MYVDLWLPFITFSIQLLTDLIKVVVKLLILTKIKVINYTLVTIVIIPLGTCSDVVVISPCPAELLPATLIIYVLN